MRSFFSGVCVTALATSVALLSTAPSFARGGGGMGGVMVHGGGWGGGMRGGWGGGGMRGGWGGGGWGHAAWVRPGVGWGHPGWGHAAWGHPGWRGGWGHPGWRRAGWGWGGGGWGWGGCGWGWGGCGSDFFWPAAGFVGGALVGSAIANSYYQPYYQPYNQPVAYGNAHVQWCANRYRSYRAWDNTFQPYNGPRQQCISPY